jgi:putative ABC transport system permease protein
MTGWESTRVVFGVAISTLRARWIAFAGAFLALAAGVAIVVPMLLTLAAALTTRFPGPQRFALAPVVVSSHDSVVFSYEGARLSMPLGRPAPLPRVLVSRLSSVGRTVSDRSFSVRVAGGGAGQVGHGWSVAALGRYRLTAGRAPSADNEVVIAGTRAGEVGRLVSVETPAGRRSYVVSGVVGRQWFEQAVFFSDREAARLEPGVSVAAVFASPSAVRRVVGSAANVLTGPERKQADPDPTGGRNLLTGTEITAEITTSVVSFVAIFVVLTTFAFVTDLRRREIALFRVVGATPRQVRRMIVAEATLIGVVASLVGCAAGAFAGPLVGRSLVHAGVAPGWFTVRLSWWPLVVGFATGLTCALAGSTVTGWRAGRVAPIDALRDAAVDERPMTPLRWVLGVAMLLTAVSRAAVTISGSPYEMINLKKITDIPLLFVGALALLLPAMLPPLVRALTWPLGRFGPGAMIVRANAISAACRTAATASVFVIAVGVAAAFLVIQDDADSAVVHEAMQTSRADYVVLPTGGISLPHATVAALRRVPGIDIAPIGIATIYLGSKSGEFIDAFSAQVVDPAAVPSIEAPTTQSGSLRQFRAASLIIDHMTATDDDLRAGERLAVWGPDGTKRNVTIAAITDIGLIGGPSYLSAGAVNGAGTNRVDVRVLPGTPRAGVATALRDALSGQPAKLLTHAQAVESLKSSAHRSGRTTTFLVLGIALIYSLIAVANTMVMAGESRRKELAALNLVGATRQQILALVAAESIVVAAVGTVVADFAGLSVLLADWIAIHHLIGAFPIAIPWLATSLVAVACAVIGVLAATVSAANTMRGQRANFAAVGA